MDLKQMLHLEYWLALRPLAMTSKTAIMLTAWFGLMIVASVAFKAIYRKLKKTDRFMSYAWRKLASMFAWLGSLGLVMTFFRYEGAPFFGMRLWYIVWLLAFVIWGALIAWYRFKELPKLLAANHEAAMK